MEKKIWSNAELMELGVESTKNETKDFPHFWVCKGCSKHYIVEPKGACERCGSTEGYAFNLGGQGNAATLPDFSFEVGGKTPELSQ